MSVQPLSGAGSVVVAAPAALVLAALLDTDLLVSLIPGAERVERLGHGHFRAVLSFGVGGMRTRNTVELEVAGLDGPGALTLRGQADGTFGAGAATGQVALTERIPGRTSIAWSYDGTVTGRWVRAGGPLLRFAAGMFVNRFFRALAARARALDGANPSTHPPS